MVFTATRGCGPFRISICASALLMLASSCSLPDPKPLPEECNGCADTGVAGCDEVAACNPDCGQEPEVMPDVQPEIEIVPELPDVPDIQPEVDVIDVPDELEEIETVDVPTCSEETECKTAGVCKDVVAVCNLETLEWVCDYDSVEGLEWGGEVTCDGEDNDCDGEVDEGLEPPEGLCKTEGVCAGSNNSCDNGEWKCGYVDDPLYSVDGEVLCDELDNDCDGEVDDDVCTLCEEGEAICVEGGWVKCSSDGNSYDVENPTPCDPGLACMGEGVCTLTDAFRVNEYLPSTQNNPALAVVGGNVVVAWESLGQDGDDLGVYFKILDDAGADVVGDTQGNLYTLKEQQMPAVAALNDDLFVIGWESSQQDLSEGAIMARVFGTTGTGGAEILLNETTAGHQGVPALATLPAGGAMAVWSGEVEGAGIGIYARKLSSVGWPDGPEELFGSGNETDSSPAVAVVGTGAVAAWQRGILDLDIHARYCPDAELPCGQPDKGIALDPAEGEYKPDIATTDSMVLVSWSELVSKQACWVVCNSSLVCEPWEQKVCAPGADPVMAQAAAGGDAGFAMLWLADTGPDTQALMIAPLASDGELATEGSPGAPAPIKSAEPPYVFPGDAGIDLVLLPGGKAVVAWSADDGSGSDDIWAQFVQLDFPIGE